MERRIRKTLLGFKVNCVFPQGNNTKKNLFDLRCSDAFVTFTSRKSVETNTYLFFLWRSTKEIQMKCYFQAQAKKWIHALNYSKKSFSAKKK